MKSVFIIISFWFMLSDIVKGQDTLIRIQENSSYFTDNKNVFVVVSNKLNSSGILCPIDFASEIIIGKTEEKNKLFDNNGIILNLDEYLKKYSEKKRLFEATTIAIKIPDITFEGFRIIEKNFASYNNRIYYQYEEIKGIEYNSFEIISNKWEQDYCKDKKAVFYGTRVITDADPATFEVMDYHFAKDNKHIYFACTILDNADPSSFQILDYTYQKDNKHFYVYGKPINADVKTFKIVKYRYPEDDEEQVSIYAIDKSYVYFQGEVIPDADPKTFKLLCSDAPYQYYGIDKNHVYYNDKILEGADVKTFKVVTNKSEKIQFDAYDKNYRFTRDEKVIIPNNSYVSEQLDISSNLICLLTDIQQYSY